MGKAYVSWHSFGKFLLSIVLYCALMILSLYRPSWSCLAFTFDSFPNSPSSPSLMLKVILCRLISKDLWMKGLSTSHFRTRFALCLDHKHTFILHMIYNKASYSNLFFFSWSVRAYLSKGEVVFYIKLSPSSSEKEEGKIHILQHDLYLGYHKLATSPSLMQCISRPSFFFLNLLW